MEESLKAVGMYEFRKYSPNKLSGGQKQRVSIAGVIAMHPKCIVLDEPTSALDPKVEYLLYQKFLEIMRGKTVLLVSLWHFGAMRDTKRTIFPVPLASPFSLPIQP